MNFPVDDIEAAVKSLGDRGVPSSSCPASTRTGSTGEGGPLIAWFKDPAGNWLSVLRGVDTRPHGPSRESDHPPTARGRPPEALRAPSRSSMIDYLPPGIANHPATDAANIMSPPTFSLPFKNSSTPPAPPVTRRRNGTPSAVMVARGCSVSSLEVVQTPSLMDAW